MMELRWLRSADGHSLTLQFRREFVEYFGGVASNRWTEWEDVPSVRRRRSRRAQATRPSPNLGLLNRTGEA